MFRVDAIDIVLHTVNLDMLRVGLDSHQFGRSLLIEEDLASLNNAAVLDSTVLGDGPVGVNLDVDVDRSADLVKVSNRVAFNLCRGCLRRSQERWW